MDHTITKPLPLLALLTFLATACATTHPENQPTNLPLCYHNSQYDFTFYLPTSWRGYSVIIESWIDSTGEKEHGPIIVFRHPLWTTNAPYQDMRIMVFTREQWDDEEHGRFFPYAGGMIEEMWHNQNYVFSLYSRYNATDEVRGWREAAVIIGQNRTLHPMPHLYQN